MIFTADLKSFSDKGHLAQTQQFPLPDQFLPKAYRRIPTDLGFIILVLFRTPFSRPFRNLQPSDQNRIKADKPNRRRLPLPTRASTFCRRSSSCSESGPCSRHWHPLRRCNPMLDCRTFLRVMPNIKAQRRAGGSQGWLGTTGGTKRSKPPIALAQWRIKPGSTAP